MIFRPMLESPTEGDKFFNRKTSGGYSNCIQGNTKMTCYNAKLDTLPNCVGFASGRFNQIIDAKKFAYGLNCNAEDFYDTAINLGLKVGSTPKLGAIMVWSVGQKKKSSDGCGHVAVVEEIISSTEVITSESGWTAKKLFWLTDRKKSNNWGQSSKYTFVGFIYNPMIDDSTRVQLYKGCKGLAVTDLQQKLNKCGNQISVDGSFGDETLSAVKTIQKKYKITQSGEVTDKTWDAIDTEIETNARPKGVSDLTFLLDGKKVSAWDTVIEGQNYIRMVDLENLGIVKDVNWNSTKKQVEVTTK